MAYILPDRGVSVVCDHGFPIVHPCQFCAEDRQHANTQALMSGKPERFLPRPRDWTGFAEGTDPNGVPHCPADVPSGWECPRCRRVWNPSVLACHHCPEQPAIEIDGCP